MVWGGKPARRWNGAMENVDQEHFAVGGGAAPRRGPGSAWALGGRRAVWQNGPAEQMWDVERGAGAWDSSPVKAGNGGDYCRAPKGADVGRLLKRGRDDLSDGDVQDVDHGGVGGGGGGHSGGGPGRTEHEMGADFRRHVERRGLVSGRPQLGAPSRGGDAVVRGGSPDDAEGGLLTQGYRRLAAMTSHGVEANGGGSSSGRQISPVPRPYSDAKESGVGAADGGGGRGPSRAREDEGYVRGAYSSGGEESGVPLAKQRRTVDGATSTGGGSPQQAQVWIDLCVLKDTILVVCCVVEELHYCITCEYPLERR